MEHRILCVGDPSRAYVIAQLLDGAKMDPSNPSSLGASVFVHVSGRGFSTYSGKYKGTPISIVAIGMVMKLLYIPEIIFIFLGNCNDGFLCSGSTCYFTRKYGYH